MCVHGGYLPIQKMMLKECMIFTRLIIYIKRFSLSSEYYTNKKKNYNRQVDPEPDV